MSWLWRGVLKQNAFTSAAQQQLAPNDGQDDTALLLEDPQPQMAPLQAAILAAWAVGFTVTSFLQPAGTAGIPVDNPPFERQVAPDVSGWQQNWAAQGRNRAIAAFTGSVDTPLPKDLAPDVSAWIVNWQAQKAAPNAAWNVPAAAAGDAPPVKARTPDVAQWAIYWSAQGPAKNAAWNFVAAQVDNPPPLSRTAASGAWWTQYSVTTFALAGGADSVAVATVDDPPPVNQLQQSIIAAWQPQVSVTLLRAPGSGMVTVDDPLPPRASVLPQIALQWAVTWRAQGPKLNAWNTSAQVAADNPPVKGRTPDVSQWAVSWNAQGPSDNAAWNFVPAQVDNPPVKGRTPDVSQWATSWNAQGPSDNAAWNFVAAQVDNPPVRLLKADVSQWTTGWNAQGPAKNAAWNGSTDNPPVKGRTPDVSQWATSWNAQGPAKNAAWNFIPAQVDNPPLRRAHVPSTIVLAWQQSWPAQHAGPLVQPSPEVVPVYGWGARSKVGSSTGRDPWTRIGSSSASASDGKIGSEDA